MNEIATQSATPPDLKKILRAEDSAGNWLPPAMVTDQMRLQARAVLADMQQRMVPAQQDSIRAWLVQLGTLCAGKISVEEATQRVNGYADLLSDSFEAGCFTRGSLKRVAAKFTWFPSFAEVNQALQDEKRRLWVDRKRLEKLARKPAEARKDEPMTPARIAELREEVARLEAAPSDLNKRLAKIARNIIAKAEGKPIEDDSQSEQAAE